MDSSKVKYRLTMTPEEARVVNYALELYMRLKLGQYEELPWALLDLQDPAFCDKRDASKWHLKEAFNVLFRDKHPGEYKDDLWYRIYNIHQVVRHAICKAEFPESHGVWSYEPMDFGNQGLPEIEIIKE